MRKFITSELPYACLIAGLAASFVGITGKMIDGPKGDIRFTAVSDETRWISLLVGVIMTALSILYLRKHPFVPPAFTDEEVRQAKEKLDRMYLREHGELPQTPEAPAPKPARPAPRTLTPEEEARAVIAKRKIRQGLLLMLAGVIAFYAAGNLFVLILSPVLFMVGLCRAAVGAAQKP